MKIAFAVSENHIKSQIDPHFGRCDWYCIFDEETRQFEFIENPARRNIEKAGHKAVDFLAEKGIRIAVAGRFGSKVVELFRAKNIQMIVPEKETTMEEIVNQIK